MNITFEIIFALPIGILFIRIGLLIWKKQKISLIHAYHYTKVKEEDKKAYTALMGKAICIIGIGIILAGIIDYIAKGGGFICFLICFIYALVIMNKAQKKYNGSLF